MTLTIRVMLLTSLTGLKLHDGKAYPENVKSRDYMKGLIALRQSTDAFRLKSLKDIKDRVHLITVPGQNGVEKRM